VKPTPSARPKIFHARDIYASGVVARATKFGTVTYHDQKKNFWGQSAHTPNKFNFYSGLSYLRYC